MIAQENPVWQTGTLEHPYGRGIHLAMLVDTLDVLLQSLLEHHYPLFAEPAEQWYRQGHILLGRREFLVMDPDGYLLRFAQSLGERPLRAQEHRFFHGSRRGDHATRRGCYVSEKFDIDSITVKR